MCDTILATPGSSADHVMLFGKNSDRQRNEAQAVEQHARADHAAGSQLKCTYLTIPQVRQTYATLLCRPFWIWGAEMGANEHGLLIGNEGLLTPRHVAPQEKALVGMDLLRLALERAATAAEAIGVITTLLERHGQGGDCGHLVPNYYHNGFLIADPTEAYVLETIGREWLVEKARGIRTISNCYSIGCTPERTSVGLNPLLRSAGWQEEPRPDYAQVIATANQQHIGSATTRQVRSTSLLQAREGHLTPGDIMAALRDHGSDQPTGWQPRTEPRRCLCVHAGDDKFFAQTTGSLVSELHASGALHWVTGTSAPCLSIFKPVLPDSPLPAQGPALADRYDARTLWWRHERLHRVALQDFAVFHSAICEERDALEADFRERVRAVLVRGSPSERAHVVAQCWREADEMEARWLQYLPKTPPSDTPYDVEWARLNHLAHMPE